MRPTLLLVDDDAAIQNLVRAILSDEEINIRAVSSGQAALAFAANACPDLVLLDIDMPGMNGFEVCRRMRDDIRSMGAEIIFLSSGATSAHKVRGLELGAIDYITKPFDADELRARVLRSLRAKARLDATRSRRADEFISRSLERPRATHA